MMVRSPYWRVEADGNRPDGSRVKYIRFLQNIDPRETEEQAIGRLVSAGQIPADFDAVAKLIDNRRA